MTPEQLVDLETTARGALPAAREMTVSGWTVRISGGPTKRVNSANPVSPGARLDAVRSAAEAAYAEHGLPALFRLTPLAHAECDKRLHDAGYAVLDTSWTMVAPLGGHAVDDAVLVAAGATPEWLAGLAAASGWSAEAAVAHRARLAALPAGSLVAMLVEEGRAVGFGVAGAANDRVCLADIMIAADRRGRGIGRRTVATLLGRAAAAKFREAMLQVRDANEPARNLYRSLGFADAYPYHYRVRR